MARVFGAHRSSVRTRLFVLAAATVTSLLLGVTAFRRGDDLSRVAPVLLAIGLGLTVLTLVLFVASRYRVVISDDGIRINGPRSLLLGQPKKLRCGQYQTEVIAPVVTIHGRVKVPQKHLWVAVEGEQAQVVFREDHGALRRPVGWPVGRPPETANVFYGDVIALRDAIGPQIR